MNGPRRSGPLSGIFIVAAANISTNPASADAAATALSPLCGTSDAERRLRGWL